MNEEGTEELNTLPAEDPMDGSEAAAGAQPMMATMESAIPGTPGQGQKYAAGTEDSVSRAYIQVECVLQSNPSQKIFKRYFTYMDNKLYQLSVVLRILATEAGARAIEEIVEKEFKALEEEISVGLERLREVLKQHGYESMNMRFSNPKRVIANVSSPRGRAFLSTLQRLDEMVSGISLLWFVGVFDNAQHTQGCYSWQRKVTHTVNRVNNVCSRALSAAREVARSRGGAVGVSKIRDKGGGEFLTQEINSQATELLEQMAPDQAARLKLDGKMESDEVTRERAKDERLDSAVNAVLGISQ